VIVIDSSALIAVLRREPEADHCLQVIDVADRYLLSAVSLLETSMVLAGRTGDQAAWAGLDALIARAAIEVVAQDEEQAGLAREAFRQGAASGRAQPGRLRRLHARPIGRRAAAVQGRGIRADRSCSCCLRSGVRSWTGWPKFHTKYV